MTKAKFQIGDHVELISGGPTMTVNKIVYDNKESLKEEIKDLNLDLPLESYFTIDSEETLLPDKINIQTFDNFIAKEYSNYTALLLTVVTNENNVFLRELLHENLKELY
jgi:hypothetical protein